MNTDKIESAKARATMSNDKGENKRAPQMVTVNGDKVSHGHAFQSASNKEDWFFTAKLNGVPLKPQKMDAADVAAYAKKEISVPELMEKYYPTKLMAKVPEEEYKTDNKLSNGLEIEKFNAYKESNHDRNDFGKWKFYAKVGGIHMSVTADRHDLNAYFDRVSTPAKLVEKIFAEQLRLPSYYEQFKLPEEIDPKGIRITKPKDGKDWVVSVDLGERGRTSSMPISFNDRQALWNDKTATYSQIAAKYLGNEIKAKLSESPKQELSKSMKI